MGGDYSWTGFYQELADKLVPFRDRRGDLITVIEDVYKRAGIKLPTLENGGRIPADMDPFTVFGLFNKGLGNKNRILIARNIAECLGMNSPVPEVFDGIPLVNNLSATYYLFDDERKPEEMDRLWDVFLAAMDYADAPSEESQAHFIDCFDKVRDQRRIKWNLTMGLFWIRPYFYINLDGRNRWYLYESGEVHGFEQPRPKGRMMTAEEYLDTIGRCRELCDSGEMGLEASRSYHTVHGSSPRRSTGAGRRKPNPTSRTMRWIPMCRRHATGSVRLEGDHPNGRDSMSKV